ncbi:hypothetical protein P5V15_009688 [Pogonomyrmex californicus]
MVKRRERYTFAYNTKKGFTSSRCSKKKDNLVERTSSRHERAYSERDRETRERQFFFTFSLSFFVSLSLSLSLSLSSLSSSLAVLTSVVIFLNPYKLKLLCTALWTGFPSTFTSRPFFPRERNQRTRTCSFHRRIAHSRFYNCDNDGGLPPSSLFTPTTIVRARAVEREA